MAHDHPDHDHDHHHDHDHVSPQTTRRRGEPLARGAGAGKVLFLDAFSGLAGDMLVAALLDLGVPEHVVRAGLGQLPLDGYGFVVEPRERNTITALGVRVPLTAPQPSRNYAQIRAMLDGARQLPEGARALAQRAFEVLAHAEADVHGCDVEHVHFHEVGAVDSIVDIVAAAIALDHLGATVVCSPLPMGRGMIRSAHGPLPVPAPATLACLSGVPTYDAAIDAELVTPTGACLVRAAATRFARWPAMTPERIGWGAGTRELADRPNVLRVVLGTAHGEESAVHFDERPTHCVLELNVDDLTGELAASALTAAFDAGALDAWTTSIGMKKGRPAIMLSALATRSAAHSVAHALLRESSSLGLRVREVSRIERPRHVISVETEFGPIRIKVGSGDGLPEHAAPEHEDCRLAAEKHRAPVRNVYAAAIAAYWSGRPFLP
jgi:uncharacterized protein (TIGR00299 family) protein